MAGPNLPPDVEEALVGIVADMQVAWKQIKDEEARILARWPGETRPKRLDMLRALERNVTDLMDRLEKIITGQVPQVMTAAYETGAWGAALQVGTEAAFSAVDIDAITTLSTRTMEHLLSATQGVRQSTKAVIQDLSRSRILNATYGGLTSEQAGVRLAADLVEQGIRAVVYKDGSRVGIASYADMVLRTESAIAVQEGGFQQGRELGIEWWEVMDGPDCGLSYHDDPTLADGLIVDRATAEKYPIAHPNCVRVTSPRPDVQNAREAKTATRTADEARVADQAQASRARAQAIAMRPRRIRLEGQVNAELARRTAYVEQTLSAAAERHARRTA